MNFVHFACSAGLHSEVNLSTSYEVSCACDGLGSVKALVDSKAYQISRYSYDEWGVPDPSSNFKGAGHPNTYGFTGEDWDPDAELLYLRARYYDPKMALFGTPDPASDTGAALASFGYLYAENNPVNLIDPSGKFSILIQLTGNLRQAKAADMAFDAMLRDPDVRGVFEKWASQVTLDLYVGGVADLVTKFVQAKGFEYAAAVLTDLAPLLLVSDLLMAPATRRQARFLSERYDYYYGYYYQRLPKEYEQQSFYDQFLWSPIPAELQM